ncbi:pyrroloquinoline quinone biosynthesis protein PqqB [Halotalea alkalilenta]|uniref:pyrroloquinoline quinone biosynthesis protein PqqB n=1 Tax=Halotalea alkalilenta TaxID=376489 RepID=UPI000A4BFF8C|nr:pyrroloquinoline quinone biosynthesis protein PqqB [Halotalea alkalilenta]
MGTADGSSPSALRLLVLGAAAGGGAPQWNCRCSVCARAWSGDAEVVPRTQASIAVSLDGERWTLIDCAPEVLAQIQRNPELHPRGPRHSPIEAVVLTGGDIDHIAGLLSLREGTPFTLYASGELQRTLADNRVFDVLRPDVVTRTALGLDASLALPGGLEARVFAVPGKAALYQPDEGEGIGAEGETTVGVEFRHAGRRLYYVPGCARLSPALAERLEGADVVLFDGTLWRDDELIREGLGHKTGARMGHLSMSGPDGSIAALAPLGIRRKVFVHINNSNPVLIEHSAERREAERAGWEIAFDGMQIVL